VVSQSARVATDQKVIEMKIVKKHLLVLASISSFLSSQSPAQISGVIDEWWTPGFSARVKLDPCENKLCGTITWAWDEKTTDVVDRRPLVGQRIISGMVANAAQGYSGSIYNPEDGRTYSATMRLKSPNTLLVEGCVLFICQKQVWRRYSSASCPMVAVSP
jgi:Delta7-sterol 5-desaturase